MNRPNGKGDGNSRQDVRSDQTIFNKGQIPQKALKSYKSELAEDVSKFYIQGPNTNKTTHL